MPEDPKASANLPVEPALPEPPVEDEDFGDFIARHVLEKDSVFFEG